MRFARSLVALALMMAVPSLAGEQLDAFRQTVVDQRAALGGQLVTQPKAARGVEKADQAWEDALGLLVVGDAKGVKGALKRVGKGMIRLEKAAKKEGTEVFSDFVFATESELWTGALGVFAATGDIGVPPPEDEEALRDKLDRKTAAAIRIAAKGKLGKAVSKLAKGYKTLLLLDPDP